MAEPAKQNKDTVPATPEKEDGATAEPKTGVFVCHCGSNIAGVVDCGKGRQAD